MDWWSGMYDSFGNCQVLVDTVENNLRFPGQYYDQEIGLYYNLNRYYDPKIGRYLQTDPAGDGLNPYVYAASNPVNAIDPDGLCALRMYGDGVEMYFGAGLIVGALTGPPGWVLTAGGVVVGSLMVLNGADNLIAGSRSLGGKYKQAVLERVIASRISNPTAAGLAYGASQLALGLGGAMVAGQVTTWSQAGRFIGEELVEEGIETVTGVPVGFMNGIKGTLTATEIAEIHAIAKKYDTTIDAVGSRASGKGRNIDTNFPVGKGDYSRSDIDFRIDTKHPLVNDLMKDLNEVGKGSGNASLKHGTDHRPTYPPFIRFTPQKVILVNDRVWRIK